MDNCLWCNCFSSFSYHHLSKSTLIERGLSNIDDIGSSDNYVWFRRADYIVAANPFSGKFIPISKVEDSINSIIWGSSMFGYAGEDINLSEYFKLPPSMTNFNTHLNAPNGYYKSNAEMLIETSPALRLH